jgi:hypothetical protein
MDMYARVIRLDQKVEEMEAVMKGMWGAIASLREALDLPREPSPGAAPALLREGIHFADPQAFARAEAEGLKGQDFEGLTPSDGIGFDTADVLEVVERRQMRQIAKNIETSENEK